MESGAKWKLF